MPSLDDKRPKSKAPVSQFQTTSKMEIVLAKSWEMKYQARKGMVTKIIPRIQCRRSSHVNTPTMQQSTRCKRESIGMCAESKDITQNTNRKEADRFGGVDGFSFFGSSKLYSQVTKPWTHTKNIKAIFELDRVFQTIGKPMQIVAARRGRSDHIAFFGVVEAIGGIQNLSWK
jgi:hypothetical protein